MVEITLYNSKTRRKERLEPLDPQNVRMYVCGPTVYDRAHLGNARPVVVFDVLYRLLRHVYGAEHVTYVRNFTDVDDKINATALARKEAGAPGTLEELVHERSDETIGWYLQDMGALGALEPDHMPRATEYISDMVAMIEKLVEGGYAYSVREQSNNPPKEYVLADREALLAEHALFSVDSYDRYGALSGRSVEDMIAGSRVEVAPYKRNPMDFVLWKPSDDELPGWDSAWGRGRPGWHIECSAMAKALLGDTFDIHGGGLDLQFPHHENEIAQSCCANGTDEMAKIWMHNEMLQVEGKKMSKSLGNFFTVHDLLEHGVPGEVIRFVMLGTHYRKPMDWTEEKRQEAEKTLRKWAVLARGVPPSSPSAKAVELLADDLNTPGVIAEMHRLYSKNDAGSLRATGQLIGLMNDVLESWMEEPEFDDIREEIVALVEPILHRIDAAREKKDFETADRLREGLREVGVNIKTTKEGSSWDYTLQDAARLRDGQAPEHGSLGASVFIADWMKQKLEALV